MISVCRAQSAVRSVLFFLLLLLTASAALAGGMPVRRIAPGDIPNEYVVTLQGVPREKVDAAAREIARKVDGQLVAVWKDALIGFWIRVPGERANTMFRDSRVRAVEQNARVLPSATQPTGHGTQPTPAGSFAEFQGDASHPADPLWHLARISHRTRGPQYYQYQNGGTGVRAYTIDGGALRFHQEFVTEGTAATGPHTNPQDSPRLIEESGSNAVDATGGDDHLPSTVPHGDCDAAPPFGEMLNGFRYASDYPWFLATGLKGSSDHGTGVNSVLGGRNVGVAKDVSLVPVKALGCGDSASIAAGIHGVNWILQQESVDPLSCRSVQRGMSVPVHRNQTWRSMPMKRRSKVW
jgi:hypothetical protein